MFARVDANTMLFKQTLKANLVFLAWLQRSTKRFWMTFELPLHRFILLHAVFNSVSFLPCFFSLSSTTNSWALPPILPLISPAIKIGW
ncbi:hypothetical protein DM01DRAFT_302673 [Hesseltinella vesiculosa]|uniref:Uncharacterized protein n=1 Tax=Hesseltinella vesiculosa TaxID=101127 RepID=A0A1X2GY65_9FUNG|nr:hypothetical protein DM01DRAFT_302673 [Hesseltinella vesiculosa]